MPTQWAGWRASSIPCCFRSRSATMRYSLMRRHDRQLRLCRGLTLALMMFPTLVHAERIKDLADVQGVRSNPLVGYGLVVGLRSEEHTSELQSLMRISYAVFCLKKT